VSERKIKLNIIVFFKKRFINQLDEDKATTLAQLEKDLNFRQEQILDSARKRIDALNEEANRLKMVYKPFVFIHFSVESFY
jgi:hypothetical protein